MCAKVPAADQSLGPFEMVRNTGAATALAACCLAALAIVLGNCSQLGGARSNEKLDPNAYPSNYRADLVAHLTTNNESSDIASAQEAYVSTPELRRFDAESRYVVCLRTVGPDGRRERTVVYFSGRINQIRDATAEQCGAAAYQAFPELLSTIAVLRGKGSRQQR
jgi:hypothetical protein